MTALAIILCVASFVIPLAVALIQDARRRERDAYRQAIRRHNDWRRRMGTAWQRGEWQ